MGILKMAWRNLWRHGRRTVVTVAAMTLALFVLVLYTGLLEGYLLAGTTLFVSVSLFS